MGNVGVPPSRIAPKTRCAYHSRMSDSELTTKPTLDTILEGLNIQGEALKNGFDSVGQRLERIEIRLDRVESMVLEVRADFREFRSALREPA